MLKVKPRVITIDVRDSEASVRADQHIRIRPGTDTALALAMMQVIIEEELIRRALTKTGGNRTRAAEFLEISHRALLYKIKEFGLRD